QEVLEGAGIEGLDRVLIVSGHENHSSRRISAEHLEDVEAVVFRHADVEENKVGMMLPDRVQAFEGGAALADDFDVGIFLQQQEDIGPGERLVVDHQCTDFRRLAIRSHGTSPLWGTERSNSTPSS